MVSLRQQVFTYLKNNPNATNQELYAQFQGQSKNSVRTYKHQFWRENDNGDISRSKSAPNSIPQPRGGPIEDLPISFENYTWDDLLKMSVFGQLKLDIQALQVYKELGYLKRDIQKQEDSRYIYQEPDWFYEHQSKAALLARKGNLYLEGMRQLTGKTTLFLILCYEKMFLDGINIYHTSPSKDLSKELIGKCRSDPRLYNVYKEKATAMLRESITLENGASLVIRPCKPAALQGLTGGIWIDEFDKILSEPNTAEAFAAMLPIVITLLMKGEAFIWVSGNKGEGQTGLIQEYFKNILSRFGNFFPVCEIREPDGIASKKRELIILNDFDPKIPVDAFEREQWYINFIFELQKAIAGEEFAAAQMKNVRLDRSGIWTKADLLRAFQRYDPELIPEWDHVDKAVEGVDPGAVHGTGISVCIHDIDHDHYWVVVAEKMYGTEHTEAAITGKIRDVYEQWNCDRGVCESNSGGWLWIKDLSRQGYNFYAANFGTSNENTGQVGSASKTIERAYKEKVLKYLLENNKITIIKNEVLLREFSLYNPYENKEKGKGDIVDSLLHCVFDCAGGVDFALQIGEEASTDKEERFDAWVM